MLDPTNATVNITTTQSPPLDLPPELRNRIYYNVLPQERQTLDFTFGPYAPVPPNFQVNQQIRAEASSLYYGAAPFELIVHHRCVRFLKLWIASLTNEARMYMITKNNGGDIRIIFDHNHADFARFKASLGRMAVMDPSTTWLASGEGPRDVEGRAKWCDIEDIRCQAKEAREGGGRMAHQGGEVSIQVIGAPNEQGYEGDKLLCRELRRIANEISAAFEVNTPSKE